MRTLDLGFMEGLPPVDENTHQGLFISPLCLLWCSRHHLPFLKFSCIHDLHTFKVLSIPLPQGILCLSPEVYTIS